MSVNKGHNHEHDYGEVFCDCMNYIVDEKMKQRYFNLVKKIASNYIDDEIARLEYRKMLIQNSEAK